MKLSRVAIGAAACVMAAGSFSVFAQSPVELAAASGAPEAPAGWTAPRTEWGDPDLRGTWPLDAVGRTPTERPANLGDKAYLTDEEYQAAIAQAENTAQNYDREDEAGTIGSGHWFEWGRPLKQTSLIMEPANGRIPPLTAQGEKLSSEMRSSWNVQQFDRIGDFNSLDRCISRGLPSSMTPFPYNNGIQIFQSPGYVVLRLEIVHETRIIPLDGRPGLPATMRNYLGESRGHWEGETLVIETTNLTGDTPMNIVGPGNKPIPTSPEQKVTERLTPVGPNTILYEARVEDPVVLTAPFTLRFPWTRDETYKLFEYACHEGNTVVPNYIKTTSPRFVGKLENPSDPAEWVRDTVQR
ncbi:hypothetical protein KK137_15815 [Croceibacterium sp. LX-88]|uniref:Uncharacterized protein n=1 Tax=Croceibacterium selenioxidans TaxID=2838833 RepID=A0ABS5W7S7_9SPHN|nr:hypothetical protein [Croceibacterium selenioxidans]MBT2135805.1 hypothetical protein [Croceibacterium selenioxidans]